MHILPFNKASLQEMDFDLSRPLGDVANSGPVPRNKIGCWVVSVAYADGRVRTYNQPGRNQADALFTLFGLLDDAGSDINKFYTTQVA